MQYLLPILYLLLTSCSTEGFSILVDSSITYPSTPIQDIKIYKRHPEISYIVIGTVEGVAATDDYFTEKKTQEAALLALKTEGARIGADALILYDKVFSDYGNIITGNMFKKIHLFAEAIKYQNKEENKIK